MAGSSHFGPSVPLAPTPIVIASGTPIRGRPALNEN
jgi:hypothetical protein